MHTLLDIGTKIFLFFYIFSFEIEVSLFARFLIFCFLLVF